MWLIIDKPVGFSSFQVVAAVRKKTGVKKVGHAGTLDPFASGVLVVAVGREFTRLIDTVQSAEKEYLVRLVFGIETETFDPEGKITAIDTKISTNFDVAQFISDPSFQNRILHEFIGNINQFPPRFSAKKINGVPMYSLARAQKDFEVKPNRVTISELRIVRVRNTSFPSLDLYVRCGKGTYIRSLVRDLARKLNTVAFAQLLVRTRVGNYRIGDAITLEQLCG